MMYVLDEAGEIFENSELFSHDVVISNILFWIRPIDVIILSRIFKRMYIQLRPERCRIMNLMLIYIPKRMREYFDAGREYESASTLAIHTKPCFISGSVLMEFLLNEKWNNVTLVVDTIPRQDSLRFSSQIHDIPTTFYSGGKFAKHYHGIWKPDVNVLNSRCDYVWDVETLKTTPKVYERRIHRCNLHSRDYNASIQSISNHDVQLIRLGNSHGELSLIMPNVVQISQKKNEHLSKSKKHNIKDAFFTDSKLFSGFLADIHPAQVYILLFVLGVLIIMPNASEFIFFTQ
jgi:hypothetical protein